MMGYSVVEPVQNKDWVEAVKRFAGNEIMLFTGYDIIGQGWNWLPAIINYASLLAPSIIRRIFGPKKIGPIRII